MSSGGEVRSSTLILPRKTYKASCSSQPEVSLHAIKQKAATAAPQALSMLKSLKTRLPENHACITPLIYHSSNLYKLEHSQSTRCLHDIA